MLSFPRITILWFVATACTSSSSTAIQKTFDPCSPPQVVSDLDPTDPRSAGIVQAIASWQPFGVPELGIATSTTTLPVHFQPAAAIAYGAYDDVAGAILLNDDLSDRDTLAVVLAHELGHAFGLVHVSPDVRPSVMNPGNLSVAPNQDDALALVALWGACNSGN